MIIWLMRMSLLVVILHLSLPERCHSKEFELVAIGVRGAINFKDAGLPPGEKEDFEQFDVFGIIGLPWSWEYSSGWEMRWRLNGSAGALRGAGDVGFITTLTPGFAFTKKAWRLTLDVGGGGAFLSKWEFGRQDIGGPFQFIGHGGVSVHLHGNLVAGYRFHHMSDGTIYGNNRGVDLHMLELSYAFE
ncbi:MAG: acyloxyacyl hydrolase [Nitrospira sp.]|nr:acyloxyacyl hydrolase [Nitrospira sp.]